MLLASAAFDTVAAAAGAPRWEADGTVDPQLLQKASDENPAVFVQDIEGLAVSDRASLARRLGDDQEAGARSAPILIKMLEDPSTFVRSQAAAALARLGDAAFPAMVAALAADRPVRRSTDFPDASRVVSTYLSWAFANSAADSGPTLIAWAKQNPSASIDAPDPGLFAAVTLGMRGEGSLPQAIALLQSSDIREQQLGVIMAKIMGESAASAAP
ncbi:MAG TPA: HEAT repeat domain-containing protein, partial [Sphingomicrobium sp.]